MRMRSGGAALKGGRELADLIAEICAERTPRLSTFSRFNLWIQHAAFYRGECDISATIGEFGKSVATRKISSVT